MTRRDVGLMFLIGIGLATVIWLLAGGCIEETIAPSQEPGMFLDREMVLERFGYPPSHTAWASTYQMIAHACTIKAVEFWTLDTGVADVEVHRATQMPVTVKAAAYGVPITHVGHQYVDLRDTFMGGYSIVLICEVRVTADDSKRPVIYIPSKPQYRATVSRDGGTWEPFILGTLPIKLDAPEKEGMDEVSY